MDEVIAELGYADGGIDGYFRSAIDELLAKLPDLCRIQAGYRVIGLSPTAIGADLVHLGGQVLAVRDIVASQIRGSRSVALFACTIGAGMEELARRRFGEGDALGGHFTDVIASMAAERTAGALHDHIEAVMERSGRRVTKRFSPGYCGWPVSEQQKLFSLLGEGFCGIRLNGASLMAPIKSVSGLIGCGEDVAREAYLCGICGQEDCSRAGQAPA